LGTLDRLREATRGSDYEGQLFLVGGIVRDKVMGVPARQDIDIVLEGDAEALATFLHNKGVSTRAPVVFPRFGTAMISVNGEQVEIVCSRAETYDPNSRKPQVRTASLREDALRRDFTINTLMENLHTGEIIDPIGAARRDLELRIIRTPTDPRVTFSEDPLRMLRAVRFAARFDFTIEPETYRAIEAEVSRLSIVSSERIRDELTKILTSPGATRGMELLRESGLLSQFAPELAAMFGVTQNIYHIYDCWTHTLKVMDGLPPDASLTLRLAALFHDVGKPGTKSVDEKGNVHFYTHQNLGGDLARKIMHRLRFSNDEIDYVARIVQMHLRVGEYDSDWSDSAVRRLIRDAGPMLEDLINLTRADKSASNLDMPSVDLDELQRHMERAQLGVRVSEIRSPLDGAEIMTILNVPPGPVLRQAKDFLVNEVIEGRLRPDDKEEAGRILIREFGG
jgi:poly(A) polymerase